MADYRMHAYGNLYEASDKREQNCLSGLRARVMITAVKFPSMMFRFLPLISKQTNGLLTIGTIFCVLLKTILALLK